MVDPERSRHETEPAFVLHNYPFRETSLVLEVFTRGCGRIALVARGARRPRSALRGVLLAFQPLLLSWAGKSELRTLHKAEWQGGLPQLKGIGLLCGFYVNELLLRLLPRDDPHEALYSSYELALRALAAGAGHSAVLRSFEKNLLKELGYALQLTRDADGGNAIEPEKRYDYVLERGPVAASGVAAENKLELSGRTLLDMERDDYSGSVTEQESKALMRMLINHCLGDQVLHTRQLLRDMQQL